MIGKIIQYDPTSGKGIVILESGEKMEFIVKQWKSFNILPKYGVVVQIENDFIVPISSEKLNSEETNVNKLEPSKSEEKPFRERIFPFVQEQVKRGWKLEMESPNGFTLVKDEKHIRYGILIIFFILGVIVGNIASLLGGVIIGILIFVVFMVIGFFVGLSSKRNVIVGKLLPQENKIFAVLNGKPLGILLKDGNVMMPKVLTDEMEEFIQSQKNS